MTEVADLFPSAVHSDYRVEAARWSLHLDGFADLLSVAGEEHVYVAVAYVSLEVHTATHSVPHVGGGATL